jgi:hypothetical protein
MKEMCDMACSELVELHNSRSAEPIVGPWKKSKQQLIERISALGKAEADDAEADVTEAPKQTVGVLVKQLLLDPDLSYSDIVALVKETFAEARTTVRSVASVACVMRRKSLFDVPMRRGAGK